MTIATLIEKLQEDISWLGYNETEREIIKHMKCAITLLKEQETEDTGRCRIFQCKKCGFGIDDIFVTDEERYQIVPRYCPNCGRSVV